MVIGSQALVAAAEAPRVAAAVQRLGMPVYLSGMARGLLGRDHALQMRHQRRKALREADCVLLAGVPCDFRLDYGTPRAALGHARSPPIAARTDARLNRRPDIAAIGDAGPLPRSRWRERVGERRAPRRVDRERCARATPSASARSTRRRERAGEHVNPVAFFRALDQRGGRQRDLRRRRRRFRRHRVVHPAPARPARLARSRRVRHARRRRGLRARRRARAAAGARSGSSGATARAATASPSSTPSCATASR